MGNAFTVTVNRRAPVVVDREINIVSPPEIIWEWIRRVDLWEDWHPEVSSAWLIEEEAAGARFKWRKKLLGVRCAILDNSPAKDWAWRGSAWGVRTTQTFVLDGDFRSTRLASTTTLEGPAASLLRPVLRRVAVHWTEVWLGALKTHLESQHERKRSRGGGTPAGPPSLSEMIRRSADRERARLGF